MTINWYPGHMHKANREMRDALPQVDLIIELLDCRLPYSSMNPAISALAADKPCIKILSKADLADPTVTALWQTHLEQTDSVKTLPSTPEQADKAEKLTRLCHKLVPGRPRSGFKLLAMITGIPNVGKSTLINAVAGRKIARTGDEPAITRGLQKINLDNGIVFLDTPGILWPKIHNRNSGYRLAASGAIKDTALEVQDVALFLGAYLLQHYPDLLLLRYDLDTLPASDVELLELLGARRGCLRGGGRVDLEKAASILVTEFRAGQLGRITLETPEMMVSEEQVVERERAEKAERRKQRKARSRGLV